MNKQTRGQRNIAWIERYCMIPEGRDAGQPVKLRTWQKRIIRKIYDTPTRTAIISFGRKNAKTTLSAFLLCLHVAGPEAAANPNSQLYSSALSRDQAALLFNLAAKVVRMSPELHAVIGIRDSAKQLYCEQLGTLYRALSSDASTAHGLSPVFVVHDELGQVRGPTSALYEALETGAGAHENPLSIVISTQAPNDGDLLSILIDDAEAGHDERTKLFLYTTPEDWRPFTKKAIRKANPAFGDFLNETEVLDQAQKARRMPSREAGFRNLVLNQRVNQETPFIPRMIWRQNQKKVLDDGRLEKHRLRIGLDLSARNDLTALVARWDCDGTSHVRADFFAPALHIADRSLRDRIPYDTWAAKGWITTTPGASVDYDEVASRLIWYADRYDLEAVFFDRWRIDVLEDALARQGVELPLIPHGQGFKDMSPALDQCEADLLNGRLRCGDNPVLNNHAANAIATGDEAGNRKLNKKKSTGRIDGMIALVMTYGGADIEVPQYVSGEFLAI